MSNQELSTIDPAALAQVSGGTTPTFAPVPTGLPSDPMLTALTGVLSTIQSMTQQKPSGFNQQELMLLMMIMQQRRQPVVVAPPWGTWGTPMFF